MRRFLAWLTGKRESQTQHSPTAGKAESPAENHTRFAVDLYLRLKDYVGHYDNVVCSPFAVSLALASLHTGARGRTAAEIEKVLHPVAAADRWQSELTAVRNRLLAGAGTNAFVLSLANGLWTPAEFPLLKEFREAVAQFYGAEPQQTDFSQEDSTRNAINQWAKGATRHMFDAVVARSELTPDARLLSISALCFNGLWAHPFGIQQTIEEPFWVNPHTKILASMMWQRGPFAYGQFPFHFADRIQVIELPYAGGELSMVFLLPEGIEGVIELEHTMGRQTGKLPGWLGELRPRKVDVTVPKFAFGSRFNLEDSLGELGLSTACSQDDAEFTGMRPARDVFLSHVFHQALVAIDEYGPDGDAAAGGPAKAAGGREKDPGPVPMFRADHPFLFLVRERISGQFLLIGRVMNPPVAPKFTPVL